MKYLLHCTIVLSLVITSCKSNKIQDFSLEFPLNVPVEHSLFSRWAGKEVKDSILIDDMEGKLQWNIRGIGNLSYSEDRKVTGRSSLRYQTAMRDTAHLMLPRNRTSWGSLGGDIQGGYNRFGITFDEPQDWSEYNRISIWVYIHPTANRRHHFCLEIINEGTEYNTLTARKGNDIHDLEAGRWHEVLWEIPHRERDKVKQFNINHTLTGFNPEGEDLAIYYFDRLQLQKVDADNYEGWSVPAENFAFSHVGYRSHDSKIALFGGTGQRDFRLIDQDNKEVYKGTVEVIRNKNGIFQQLDFSEFQKEGIYRLQCGTAVSNPFPINQDIWLNPLFSAINFYFCQRCGFDVPGIHGVCHEDWQGFYGNEKKVVNGGWHDAGDLSQGTFRTATGVYALLRNLELVQQNKALEHLAVKLQDEVAWGLKWLLKTKFSDGYRMSWSCMRIYTDNIIGTIDDVVDRARNVPWENFLCAAVECKASQLLEIVYPELANEARKTAIEDWQAAMASREIWERASYQEASWGAISSILLYKMTGNDEYKKHAIRFGSLLMQCQEKVFQDGIPITGYFYTNTDHTRIIQNNHAAHDEGPLLALKELCMAFPNHENRIDWYSSAVIHSEYFVKRGSEISAPYYLVPNAIYRKSDILAITDADRQKLSLIQFNDGTTLNDEYTLRTFPIWNNATFHGGTNTQLATTWALAESSILRNDPEGMQLVGKQLEWVLGSNPFGQSLMYGVGYNFPPQFAYCTKNVVGSIAVGMDCLHQDVPYFDASNFATAKEMWIEPVNRFLGTLAAYTENRISSERKAGDNVQIDIEHLPSANGGKAILTIKGTGSHNIDLKAFNAKTNLSSKSFTLSQGKSEKIELDITILDNTKPYVIIVTMDGKVEVCKEIFGAKFSSI